ncbi:MAG: hypothetical protein IH808_11755 [Proteobacteria bacterium]|nr:hypothetical protein [Pseudomonadota bacterium]
MERQPDADRVEDEIGLERARAELEERFFHPPVVPQVDLRVSAGFADVVRSALDESGLDRAVITALGHIGSIHRSRPSRFRSIVPYWVRQLCRHVLQADAEGTLDPVEFGITPPVEQVNSNTPFLSAVVVMGAALGMLVISASLYLLY